MNIIKNTYHRVVPGFFIVVFVFASVASPPVANAQVSANELVSLLIALNIIPSDKAQLARSFVTNQTPTASVCPYSWARNLTTGASGPDVLALQRFLNANTATRVAVTGVGSPGMESQTYGPLTADAVRRFQNIHASEVLAPLGLTQGTGFLGSATRAKMNSLCATGFTQPQVPPVATPPTSVTPSAPVAETREATLARYRIANTPSNVVIEEREVNDVFVVQFEVRDADVTLSRADIAVKAIGTVKERRPWNLLREISLYDGSTRIATQRVDSQGAWVHMGNDEYRVRLSGINQTFDERESARLTVRAEVLPIIDSADAPQDVEFWIPDQGLRFRDGARVDHYLGSNTQRESMVVEKAGRNERLTIRQTEENPTNNTFVVKRTSLSEEHTLLAFELDAKDYDIQVNQLPVSVYTFHIDGEAVAYDTVFQRLWLEIDGVRYDESAMISEVEYLEGENATTTKTIVTFNLERDTVVVPRDTTKNVVLKATFRRQSDGYVEGQRVLASITRDNMSSVVAEGVRRLTDERMNGQALGNTHTLRTEGLILNGGELVARARGENQGRGEFSVTFTAQAFNNTLYVPMRATLVDVHGTVVSGPVDGGVRYRVVSANTLGTGTSAAILNSTARRVGDAYEVREGATETFTLVVNYDPDTTDFYRVILEEVGFRTAGKTNAEATFEVVRPEAEFATEYTYVQG